MIDFGLTDILNTTAHDWRTRRLADDPVMPAPMRRALCEDHGEDVTLGDLHAMDDARLLRSANVGSLTLRHLRRAIDYWIAREIAEADAAERTVRWEDGDHGSEFITPEEYARRKGVLTPPPSAG